MSTKYLVTRTEQDATATLVATKAKKSDAIALADAERASSRRTVTVTTEKGTEVYVVQGVRPMKSTPRYSRVVPVPEGVVVPNGMRVAYNRHKHNALILHDADAPKEEQYAILTTADSVLLEERFATTRDAGQAVLAL